MTAKKNTKGATRRKRPFPIREWSEVVFRFLPWALMVAATVVGLRLIGKVDWQPMALSSYKVSEPFVYQDEQAFKDVMAGYLFRSLLFLDLKKMQEEIESLPWVYEARVMKRWPGMVSISIVEHEPVARWNGNKVLNSEGIPLQKPVAQMALASLVGPENGAGIVMSQYLQFTQVFEGLGLQIQEVTMHPRGSWYLKMENGVSIALGDKNVLERSRRVVRVLGSATYDGHEIEYIDARYPNGVAIRIASTEALEV